MDRIHGQVRWFNIVKGYGFLSREDAPDVFVHFSAIENDGFKSLRAGDQVEYQVVMGEKGPQADAVRRLKNMNPTSVQPPHAAQ